MVVTRGKSKKGQTNANNNAPSPSLPAVGNLRDRPNDPTFNEVIQEGMPYINRILEENNPGSKPNQGAKPAKKPAGGNATKPKKPTKSKKKTKPKSKVTSTKNTTTKVASRNKGNRKNLRESPKNQVVNKPTKKVQTTNLEDNNNEEITQPTASAPSISSLSLQLQVVELKIDKLYNILKKSLKVKRRKSTKSTNSNNSPRHHSRKQVVHIPASRRSETFSDVEFLDVKKPSVGQYLPPKESEYRFVCVHVSFLYLFINVLWIH